MTWFNFFPNGLFYSSRRKEAVAHVVVSAAAHSNGHHTCMDGMVRLHFCVQRVRCGRAAPKKAWTGSAGHVAKQKTCTHTRNKIDRLGKKRLSFAVYSMFRSGDFCLLNLATLDPFPAKTIYSLKNFYRCIIVLVNFFAYYKHKSRIDWFTYISIYIAIQGFYGYLHPWMAALK